MYSEAVQPQEGLAAVITTGALVVLVNRKVTSALGPILIEPKSCDFFSHLIPSSVCAKLVVTKAKTAAKRVNVFFMVLIFCV